MIITENTKVNLIGKSKKGKERIKRDGAEDWLVMKVSDTVLFSDEHGPWVRLGKEGIPQSIRWVNLNNDLDFQIVDNS